ncbi:hypothetical protein MPQ_1155 [Methylovorus sp. MP688]|nr:hypothetical protein MPQ_1155 [Methylovorus sp. MP688]
MASAISKLFFITLTPMMILTKSGHAVVTSWDITLAVKKPF